MGREGGAQGWGGEGKGKRSLVEEAKAGTRGWVLMCCRRG